MKRTVDGINLFDEAIIDAEQIQFNVQKQRLLEIPTKQISNVNNTPLELIIHLNDDEMKPNEDALVEIRLYAHDPNGEDKTLERLYRQIRDNTTADESADPIICVLPNLPFAVPRGRFSAHFAEKYVKLHGASFNYSINYKNIIRAFWLELPERATGYFVIGFDKPLIQGQTDYKYTIIQFKIEEQIEIQMGPRYDELPKVNQSIQRTHSGPYFQVFTEIFKAFTGIGVVVPGDFKKNKNTGLACSVGAKQGYLFFLNKSLIFILKPIIYIKYDEIAKVIFHRIGSGHTARGFDVEVMTKGGSSTTFSGIDRSELDEVTKFLKDNNLLVEAAREDDIKDDEYEDDDEDEEDEDDIEKSGVGDSEEEDDDFIAKDGDEDDEDEEDDGDFEGESDEDDDDEPKQKSVKTADKKDVKNSEVKPPKEKSNRKPKEPIATRGVKAPKPSRGAKEPKKNGHRKEPAP